MHSIPPKDDMGPEDVDPVIVNAFLKNNGPDLVEHDMDNQNYSRCKFRSQNQQANCVKKNTYHP